MCWHRAKSPNKVVLSEGVDTMEVLALARPHLLSCKPYSSAKDEYNGDKGIFLNVNENPYGPSAWIHDVNDINRYPDPYQQRLKTLFSNHLQVTTDSVFVGNGSDEIIDLLVRVFCEPGKDKIIVLPPTYGMYQAVAGVNNVGVIQVPLTSTFGIDMDSLLTTFDTTTKMLFLVSPNNPTGNNLDEANMLRLLDEFPGIVVVDEAYIDFSSQQSMARWGRQHPRLVVIRTMSKAWGLAGIRLGFGIGHPDIIRLMNKVKPPYNVSAITQQIGCDALTIGVSRKDYMVELIQATKKNIVEQLESLVNIIEKVYPSDTNFILVKFKQDKDTNEASATRWYNKLLEAGVVVRSRANDPYCPNCLRITIGTNSEMALLMSVLGSSDTRDSLMVRD
jgi:histidinol-phosphate aminotransferase